MLHYCVKIQNFYKAGLFFIGLNLPTLIDALPLQTLQFPPGFKIDIYAQVPNARSMALGSNGTVFVGTRNSKVYALVPNANQTKANQVITLAQNLNSPNGVAYKDGALYVAEINRVLRYDNIEKQLSNPPTPVVINNTLPNKTHHGWRYTKFGPDGWYYIAIGAPCDACLSEDTRFATIARMKSDGSDFQIYAKGIRNSVGFDWDPTTQHLWFTDNGRDWMGDNIPPDELNYAPQQGMNFGFPFFYGNDIPDPKYGKLHSPSEFTKPVLNLPAHVATLGMVFYTGKMFPAEYQNQIFIAEHGSWNRSKKVGYQVIVVKKEGNKILGWQPFVKGWLQGQSDWGRPVDLLVMPDGALLISDDSAGLVYRVSYA